MTAVEWLIDEMPVIDWTDPYWKNKLEKAKEMEKQQIIDAHGNQTKKSGGISNATYILNGEQYYNETFKNK